jgi:hypothetical protein
MRRRLGSFVVMHRAAGFALLLALIASQGCSDGEYELERRGGPYPSAPIPDPPRGGSGGSSGGDAGAATGGAADQLIPYCDALVVVKEKCQRCHNDPPENAAPVAFLSWEDFQSQYYMTEFMWWQIAIDMVERDVMPYVALNTSPDLVGGPVEGLTVKEKATLLGWLKQGAQPEGGTDCP